MSRRRCATCAGDMAGTRLWELYCSPACRRDRHLPRGVGAEPPALPADLASPALAHRDMKPDNVLPPAASPAMTRKLRPLGMGLKAGAFGVAAASNDPCPGCGGRVQPGDGPRPRVYCSTRCRARATSRRTAAKRSEARQAARAAPRTCPRCGASFALAARGAPKKYCSRTCTPSETTRTTS